MKPRLTIGLPVRNGDRFLRPAIDSLCTQSFTDFELLISDNASTDETESICRDYAQRDRRILYFRSSNDIGLAKNYNQLFQRARGEYFKWAAADDLHQPGYLDCCVETLDQDSSVVLAYAKARFIDENGASVAGADPGFDLRSDAPAERFRYVIFANSWVNAIFGVIRSHALAKTSLMPEYPGGDYQLLAQLALIGKFVELPDPLFLRRLHSAASSQNTHDDEYMMRLWTARPQRSSPLWHRRRDDFSSVMRSQLRAAEKLSLCGSLVRSMFTERRRLLTELLK